ncbi:hypothetical protein GCM10010238_13210 [Streptomyces griseoviridis]|uniref:Uncharacterized protein n=1 Tax=Streptomyces griseoviridis TaxID=45398 RepID=A0A918GCR3_STRGD|nr:hypothetical protein GCM10010238_13210 [Streptomyces niveoruber]
MAQPPRGADPTGTTAPEPRTAPPPGPARRRWPRALRRTALAPAPALLVPVLAVQAALGLNCAGDPADGTRTRHRDALWLGHTWVDGREEDADLAALGRRPPASATCTSTPDRWSTTAPRRPPGTRGPGG